MDMKQNAGRARNKVKDEQTRSAMLQINMKQIND